MQENIQLHVIVDKDVANEHRTYHMNLAKLSVSLILIQIAYTLTTISIEDSKLLTVS